MRERSQKKIRVLTNGKVREDIYKAVDTVEIPFTFRKIEGQSPGLLITPQPSSAGSVRNREFHKLCFLLLSYSRKFYECLRDFRQI